MFWWSSIFRQTDVLEVCLVELSLLSLNFTVSLKKRIFEKLVFSSEYQAKCDTLCITTRSVTQTQSHFRIFLIGNSLHNPLLVVGIRH